jgi:hypothetical protein
MPSLRHGEFAGCIHRRVDNPAMANPDDLDALAAAFRKARYRVAGLGDEGVLRVGTRADRLEAACPAARYAFITAWNSDSTADGPIDNAVDDGALVAALDDLGVRRLRAVASDAQGGHAESGWLMPDLALPDLDRLARQFRQDATLAWERGEAVRLRMYHRCPPDAVAALWTDWVE